MLRYNERCDKPSEQRTVLEAINTFGSRQANFDTTNPSVKRTNCVSLGTTKAYVVSKLTCRRDPAFDRVFINVFCSCRSIKDLRSPKTLFMFTIRNNIYSIKSIPSTFYSILKTKSLVFSWLPGTLY